MSFLVLTQDARDKALDKARAFGFQVVEGMCNQLLLDLDEGQYIRAPIWDKLVAVYGQPVTQERWVSKSGKGEHVLLTFENTVAFTEAEACAWECALGSDPLRAVLCLVRVRNGIKKARVLFKPTERTTPELVAEFEQHNIEDQHKMLNAATRLDESVSAVA